MFLWIQLNTQIICNYICLDISPLHSNISVFSETLIPNFPQFWPCQFHWQNNVVFAEPWFWTPMFCFCNLLFCTILFVWYEQGTLRLASAHLPHDQASIFPTQDSVHHASFPAWCPTFDIPVGFISKCDITFGILNSVELMTELFLFLQLSKDQTSVVGGVVVLEGGSAGTEK